MFHVKKLKRVSFIRRLVAPLVVFILSLGVIYVVDTPEPASAQSGWRICRADDNDWLFIKIKDGNRCDAYWISAEEVQDAVLSERTVTDRGRKGVIVFRDDDDYDTCENFSNRVFPDYLEDDGNICYDIPGVDTTHDPVYEDESAWYSTNPIFKVDIDTAIVPGPTMASAEVDLGVCISSGGCSVGYSFQQLNTMSEAVTVGYSSEIGIDILYTHTFTSGTIEGYTFTFSAEYGDTVLAEVEGGEVGFTFKPGTIAFDPKLSMRTESNCEAFNKDGIEKITEEGSTMEGKFTGFKEVYFGLPGCLKKTTLPATATCSVDHFGDPLEGATKNCYLLK